MAAAAVAATALPLPLPKSTHLESTRLQRLPERCSTGGAVGLGGAHACMVKIGLISDDPFAGETHAGTFMSNALIRALADDRRPELGILLYGEMLRHAAPPPQPNGHTFPFLLKACAALPGGALKEVRQVHGHAVKSGFASDVYTCNSLLHAYGSSGALEAAQQLFNRMPWRDSVSWNSMLKAYAIAGAVGDARDLFDAMPEAAKNVVSWTTVVHGCAEGGLPEEALVLFRRMQIAGVPPDAAALSSTLSACAQLGALEQGRWIAAFVERRSIAVDPALVCALVDMFCKCGEAETAMAVFRRAAAMGGGAANVRVWTAIIGGLAVNGWGKEALALFNEMQTAGVAPNELTLTAALTACSYSGLVAEGKAIFRRMDEDDEFRVRPTVEHLGCMVHLLGRAGLLREAREMAERADGGGAAVWGALLSACRAHGDWEMGKEVGEILLRLDAGDGGRYVNLAAVLAGEGRWGEAAAVRSLMRERGVRKLPGCSSIAVAGEVHEFVAGDCSHPRSGEIYAELGRMMARLGENGYAPATDRWAPPGLSEEETASALHFHSEKLAIAFGLISTDPGVGLRIMKNLRVCEDCHAATKLVSKVYGRRIVMRDRSRFHLFVDGSCSCGDCW